MSAHKGWHDRGYLPHLDAEGVAQHVVFRLHGSLSASRLESLKAETDGGDEHRLAIDHELDRGRGPVWLSDPGCADIVADVQATGRDARHIPARDDAAAALIAMARPGDRIVLMGARDDTLSLLAQDMVERLGQIT